MSSAYLWRVCPILMGVMLFPEQNAVAEVSTDQMSSRGTSAEFVEFDMDMLKGRNIDPEAARYFAKAPRFSEGSHTVSLYVNGMSKGQATVIFDREGQLVLTTDLLDVAHLANPGRSQKMLKEINTKFLEAYPMTQVELKPGKSEVGLIVPTDALRTPDADIGDFAEGGTAAMLNYNLMGMNNQFRNNRSEFRSLDTVAGFNIGNWIVRTRQNYSVQDGSSRTEHLYAYGQKTVTSLKSTFQGGQINIANSLFSGDSITGVQLVPEAGLRAGARNSGAAVEGVANSTARIEVRQNGALILSTVVPAGPFTLADLPLLSASTDLDVTVIEADGSRRTFSIPSASFGGGTQGAAPGYSFAVGQYRPLGSGGSSTPSLLTGSGTWALNSKTSGSTGLMAADGYQAAGLALDHAMTPTTSLGLRQVFSSATDEGRKGSQVSANLSTQATAKMSLGLSATHQTEGYRDLTDTTYRQGDSSWYQSRYRNQFTSSVGWSEPTLGNFRLSHSYTSQFDNKDTQRLVGAWSKKFKKASVSVNMEKSLGEIGPYGYGDSVFLSVTMPLGQGSLRAFANHDDRGVRTGASYNQQVNDTFGYRVQAERNSVDRDTDLSVSTNLLPRYAHATVGYSRSGEDSTTYNGSLSGAVVAHDDGVTFTPYEVNDTFSILTVGDVSGVKVTTPQGPVWTDAWGKAVAPGMQAYQNNRMEVVAKSLPRNVDISNTYKELKVGRGSVSNINFNVVTARRVLMNVTLPDGRILDKGLAVSADDQYLTTVVDKGQVFLPNIEPGAHLTVGLPGHKTCKLDFSLPPKADTDGFFETINAVCHPVQGQSL